MLATRSIILLVVVSAFSVRCTRSTENAFSLFTFRHIARVFDLFSPPSQRHYIRMLALRPLRASTRSLSSSALRSADSGESSSSYLRRQAALEDIEDALPKTPRKPGPVKEQSVFEKATRPKSNPKLSVEKPWDGEETQRKMIERVMQDSYKPLKVCRAVGGKLEMVTDFIVLFAGNRIRQEDPSARPATELSLRQSTRGFLV